MSLSGEFSPEGSEETWKYSLVDWMDANGEKHDGSQFTDYAMAHTDWAVIQVTDPNRNIRHVTIYGPWEERDEIVWELEFQFGAEGSETLRR